MVDRGNGDTRPFGRRRAGRERSEPEPAAPRADGWDGPARPGGPLIWALRTAALAGFVAVLATQYLVHLSGPGEVSASRLALVRATQADPETTGSIGRPANASPARAEPPLAALRSTRLDPCALSGPAHPRP